VSFVLPHKYVLEFLKYFVFQDRGSRSKLGQRFNLIAHLFFQVKTVKVSHLSLNALKREITEFFSFSGDIEYVEMQR
jgi:hypothetical protein